MGLQFQLPLMTTRF